MNILRKQNITFLFSSIQFRGKKLWKYRVFRAEANWTLTHMSHKDTEASITLDGVILTDLLIR
jgi:hypothetical protein